MKKDRLNSNNTVDDREFRSQALRCGRCPPNRSENSKRHAKHGTKTPKYKNKQR